MGILPLEFLPARTSASLGLTGREAYTIRGRGDDSSRGRGSRSSPDADDGATTTFEVTCRIDGPIELDYYRNGGILPAVLRRLAREGASRSLLRRLRAAP